MSGRAVSMRCVRTCLSRSHDDAVQVKLNELIRAVQGAHNMMVNLEELSPEELARVKAKYQALATRVRDSGSQGAMATNTPFIDPSPGPKPRPTGDDKERHGSVPS